MSARATAWAWEQDVRGTQKLVLLCLADWADGEHQTWYSTGHLTARVGVGRSAVFDALSALEDAALLRREARLRENGSQSSNLYTLLVESGEPDTPVRDPDGRAVRNPDPQNLPGSEPSKTGRSDDLPSEVWATYVGVMKPRRAELDPEARKVIVAALKVATVDECKLAILRCSQSAFHMGKNDRGRKYNSISQILKGKRGTRTTREQIDFMLSLKPTLDVPSASRDVIARWTRAMQTRATYPGNTLAEEQGAQAEAKLREIGIEPTWIDRPGIEGKYPTFPDLFHD